jgi:competence protein ComEC
LVAPTIAATLVTAPITALAFGTVAPIGVFTNLVAIPLAALAVPGLVFALVASWIVPPLARLFAAGWGLGLALIDGVAPAGAAVPGGHVVMVAGWRAAGLWLGVAAAGVVVVERAAASLGDRRADRLRRDDPLLDLGRGGRRFLPRRVSLLDSTFSRRRAGDAGLLRSPAGRWIVIDGGPQTPEGEPLGRPLYLEFLATVEASGARYRAARAGDRIELDGVTIDVLSPHSALFGLPLDVNEHGVVLRVTYGDVRLLFQADAGLPVEAHLAGRVGAVELLKVGHHGSRSATSDAWLAELAPHEAVISVGRHNHYGHPAPEVVARLARHGIAILRTDCDGTITFKTDGTREETAISNQPSAFSPPASAFRHEH